MTPATVCCCKNRITLFATVITLIVIHGNLALLFEAHSQLFDVLKTNTSSTFPLPSVPFIGTLPTVSCFALLHNVYVAVSLLLLAVASLLFCFLYFLIAPQGRRCATNSALLRPEGALPATLSTASYKPAVFCLRSHGNKLLLPV
jgi:hypothetical protein